MGATGFMALPDVAHQAADRLDRMEQLLVEISENTAHDSKPPVRRQRIPFNFTTDAAGNGESSLLVPQGWQWSLLRYAAQIIGLGAAVPASYVGFYRDGELPQLLLAVTTAPGPTPFTATFASEGDLVPGQSRLLVVARAFGGVFNVGGNLAVRATQDTDPTMIR